MVNGGFDVSILIQSFSHEADFSTCQKAVVLSKKDLLSSGKVFPLLV